MAAAAAKPLPAVDDLFSRRRLTLIAGPCVIESYDICAAVAETAARLTERHGRLDQPTLEGLQRLIAGSPSEDKAEIADLSELDRAVTAMLALGSSAQQIPGQRCAAGDGVAGAPAEHLG